MAHVARERSEIPVQYTWDTDSIFSSAADWETAVSGIPQELEAISQYKGRLNESAAILADYFDQSLRLQRKLRHIFVYASLNYSVQTDNQEVAARYDRARSLMGHAQAATAFDEPEMLAIGFDTLGRWMVEEPRLADYGHYFDQLEKRQAHVRSAEVEQVLGMVQDTISTASATHSVLANTDLQFTPATDDAGETYDITQGTIGTLLTHTDRTVRRTAWENYADAHLAYKNTMANAQAAGVKRDVFFARVRNYNNSLHAALETTHIPTEVFHNLIDTFRKNLPTWHRYWAIRKKALNLTEFHVYDVKAPLTDNPPTLSYETAVNWIAEGMKPLGSEYVSILKRGALEERWVDVYPNKGKRMGAFSSGGPGTHPFIMMSFDDSLFGLSTLAHELGHSLHSYYTWQNQEEIYSWYGLFAAEVASNFNQALVREHLLKSNNDPAFQISVIEEAMSNFHRYFFVMPTLARFELEIHEMIERGEALNADKLINLMADLFTEGFGSGVVIDRDRLGITWAEFHTHLYANFYVYQYATGISAAHYLANNILKGKNGAVDNYLAFLKAGGSMYPMDLLKLAGVDMTTPEPVEAAFAVMAQYVDKLERLLG